MVKKGVSESGRQAGRVPLYVNDDCGGTGLGQIKKKGTEKEAAFRGKKHEKVVRDKKSAATSDQGELPRE